MKLLIFTQKVDKNDPVLGFFHSWILEFSKHFESVEIICLEKGDFDLPKNVRVYSLGKESGVGRMAYIKNLIKYLHLLSGKYDRVFVHMNPVYLVLCGFYWRLKNIPVFLWYTHREVDFKLKIAIFWAKNVFSASKESMTVVTPKAVFVGHGIDTDKFPNISHTYATGPLRIAHIGRISRIKNIETAINAVHELKNKNDLNPRLLLYGGPVTKDDGIYKEELARLINEKNLDDSVIFEGWIKQTDIGAKLTYINLTVNMAPSGGMDKSVLESILMGIPTFMANTTFKDLLGEHSNIFLFEYGNPSSLAGKIYDFIHTASNQYILDILSAKIRRDFSVESLIGKMLPFIIK